MEARDAVIGHTAPWLLLLLVPRADVRVFIFRPAYSDFQQIKFQPSMSVSAGFGFIIFSFSDLSALEDSQPLWKMRETGKIWRMSKPKLSPAQTI